MLKIYKESVSEFTPWQGAVSTYDTIVEENKLDDLDFLLEDIYPEGISEGQLNDILWFESDWLFENLGIKEDEEDELTCDSCGETVEEQDLWAHEDGNSYCCNCYPNI